MLFVARDKDGYLGLYGKMPRRGEADWFSDDYHGAEINVIPLSEELFPELTWEHEPIEVKLEVIPKHIKPDEYFDEVDMIEMESMGIGCRVDGGFIYN